MFNYYNANPLDRNVNDCTVRAISLATEQSWYDTYDRLSSFAKEKAITFSEIEFINDWLAQNFERYCVDRKQTQTLRDFLRLNLKGRWLITMPNHITCVVDGIVYDTFDPSDKFIWCVYKVK